jgi:hypothetical protein
VRPALAQLHTRWLSSLSLLALVLMLLMPTAASAAVPTPAPAPGRASSSGGPAAPPSTGGSGASRSTISGNVLLDEDLDGSPSRGDRPLVGVGVSMSGPGLSTSAATSGGGTFSFGGLPAGTYSVSIALPGGVVALSGTSRTVTVDGSGSARADFFVGRPDRGPTPVPAVPTATPVPPMPTSTPKPLPTPVPAPGHAEPSSGGTRGAAPSSGARASSSYQGNLLPPITTSYGPRYAPGRGNPSAIEPIRTETSLWLGVPFMTQLDGTTYSDVNCGPASTAMVLSAFGIRTSPGAIRNYVNDMSGVYSLGAGTSLDHLSRVLRESGLDVTNLSSGGRYLRWSTDLLREEIKAGHPVVTLVKYRALPGHTGSMTDFDHYIVISGVAGNDFIYNDAAYSSERGYGLLISPRDLERAWDYSSIPRHGMAVSLPAGSEQQAADEATNAEGQSDEALLAESDVSLGDEVGFVDSYGALTFGRIEVDGQPEPAAEEEPALELAGFVDIEPIDAAESIAPVEQQLASRPPVNPTPTLTPGVGFLFPLAGLAVCLAVAIFALTGRRLLE